MVNPIVEAIAVLVVKWRLGLTILVSTIVAAKLAFRFAWFTGAYGVALVFSGVVGGMVWQSSYESRVTRTDDGQPTSSTKE